MKQYIVYLLQNWIFKEKRNLICQRIKLSELVKNIEEKIVFHFVIIFRKKND